MDDDTLLDAVADHADELGDGVHKVPTYPPPDELRLVIDP